MRVRSILRRPGAGAGLAFVLAAVLSLVAVVGTSAPQTAFDTGLNPLALYRALDRQVQLAYARGVRLVNHMRLIYEVHALLEAKDSETLEAAPAASRARSERPEPISGCSKSAWGNFLPIGR